MIQNLEHEGLHQYIDKIKAEYQKIVFTKSSSRSVISSMNSLVYSVYAIANELTDIRTANTQFINAKVNRILMVVNIPINIR